MQEPAEFSRAGLALPLTAFALLVYHHHFDWPDDESVERIEAALNYEPTDA
jgi:hypothetical protein